MVQKKTLALRYKCSDQTCFSLSLLQGLRAHGHNVVEGRYVAVTQAIVVDPDHDTLIGASDPRKDGAPAGY